MKRTRTIALTVWISFSSVVTPVHRADAVEHSAPPIAATVDEASPTWPNVDRPPARPSQADYPIVVGVPGATVYTADRAHIRDVTWALSRFRDAGLELPEVEVWIHDDPSGCRGPNGVRRRGYLAGGPDHWVIFSCGSRFVLLHELAHVWDNHVLTNDTRAAFLELRGLEQWGGLAWELNGGEHLANVIAWGLHEQHPRPLRTLPRDDASLTAAYVLATGGLEPP